MWLHYEWKCEIQITSIWSATGIDFNFSGIAAFLSYWLKAIIGLLFDLNNQNRILSYVHWGFLKWIALIKLINVRFRTWTINSFIFEGFDSNIILPKFLTPCSIICSQKIVGCYVLVNLSKLKTEMRKSKRLIDSYHQMQEVTILYWWPGKGFWNKSI